MKRLIVFLSGVFCAAVSCTKGFDYEISPEAYNQAQVGVELRLDQADVEQRVEDAGVLSKALPTLLPSDTSALVMGIGVAKWGGSMDSLAVSQGESRSVDPAGVNEINIMNYWALQFDEQGGLVGKPTYNATGNNQVMLTATGTRIHTVWFVANTSAADLFTVDNVPTLEIFRRMSHEFASEQAVTNRGLVMAGSYKGVVENGASLTSYVRLVPLVSKLTFSYDGRYFHGGTLKILGVQLKNVSRRVSYMPNTDASVSAYPKGEAGSHMDYEPEVQVNESAGTFTWYIPENVRGTNPQNAYDADKTMANAPANEGPYATFVEVRAAATYPNGMNQSVVYVLYLGADRTEYAVRRNNAYATTVWLRGADLADGRVMSDHTTPYLAPKVSFSELQGTSAIATGVVNSAGGSGITQAGFYMSATSGFSPEDDGVTHFPSLKLPEFFSGPSLVSAKQSPAEQMVAVAPAKPLAADSVLAALGIRYGVPELMGASGAVSGSFSALITGLVNGTAYFVRPYAVNDMGRTVGAESTFSTSGIPTVVTGEYRRELNRNILVDYQVTHSGSSPVTSQGVIYFSMKDFDPSSLGARLEGESPVLLTGLGSNQVYYYRGFATNANGTAYGEQKELRTLSLPVFPQKINDVVFIPNRVFEIGGKISASEGSGEVLERGIAYGSTPSFALKDATVILGTTVTGDEFKVDFDPTPMGDTWYLRLYCKTTLGVFFGAKEYASTVFVCEQCHIERHEGLSTILWAPYSVERDIFWSVTHPNFDPRQEDESTRIFLHARGADIGNVSTAYVRSWKTVPLFDAQETAIVYSKVTSTARLPNCPIPTLVSVDASTVKVSVASTTASGVPGGELHERSVGLNYTPTKVTSLYPIPAFGYEYYRPNTHITTYSIDLNATEGLLYPQVAAPVGSGSYELSFSSLGDNTTYYLRSRAQNKWRDVYVSAPLPVKTPKLNRPDEDYTDNANHYLQVHDTLTFPWNLQNNKPIAVDRNGEYFFATNTSGKYLNRIGRDRSFCRRSWRIPMAAEALFLTAVSGALKTPLARGCIEFGGVQTKFQYEYWVENSGRYVATEEPESNPFGLQFNSGLLFDYHAHIQGFIGKMMLDPDAGHTTKLVRGTIDDGWDKFTFPYGFGTGACFRCVRRWNDETKRYPYVDQGKVVVMRDGDGGVKPSVLGTGGGSTAAKNKIAPKFEVAAANTPITANWFSAGTGTDGSGCPAGWRTPTMNELSTLFLMEGKLTGVQRLVAPEVATLTLVSASEQTSLATSSSPVAKQTGMASVVVTRGDISPITQEIVDGYVLTVIGWDHAATTNYVRCIKEIP